MNAEGSYPWTGGAGLADGLGGSEGAATEGAGMAGTSRELEAVGAAGDVALVGGAFETGVGSAETGDGTAAGVYGTTSSSCA